MNIEECRIGQTVKVMGMFTGMIHKVGYPNHNGPGDYREDWIYVPGYCDSVGIALTNDIDWVHCTNVTLVKEATFKVGDQVTVDTSMPFDVDVTKTFTVTEVGISPNHTV